MTESSKHRRRAKMTTYINPTLGVDVACFTVADGIPYVALHTRTFEPEQGKLALPGVLLDETNKPNETILQACTRALAKTNLEKFDHIQQLGYRDNPNRDGRFRVISLPHVATVSTVKLDEDVKWTEITEDFSPNLAFDHAEIINEARLILADAFITNPKLFAGMFNNDMSAPSVKKILSRLNPQMATGTVLRDLKKHYTETGLTTVPNVSGGRPSAIFKA